MRTTSGRPRALRVAASAAASLALAALACQLPAAPAAATTVVNGAATARPAFHFRDPRIAESSGLALATRERGVYFTHDDSGDSARFFAVGTDGRTLATFTVPSVTAVDWEDMAAAPATDGTPLLWFADIGDNDERRPTIAVYGVAEPRVDPHRSGVQRALPVAVAYRLRYPDGAHDAETLLADPRTHRLYLVTKSLSGRSGVYALPARPPASGTATLHRVGQVRFRFTGSRGGPAGPFGELAATGGAVSRDGRRLAIRTYTDAYLWNVGAGGVVAALRRPPALRVALPAQPQGEGVTFTRDGRGLVLGTERLGATVYRLRLPAPPAKAGGASGSATPSPSRSAGESPGSADGGGPPWGWVGAGVAVAAGLVALLAAASRRARRPRRAAR